ncbi:myosin regulatory light chain 2 smooth muscle minor isoform [Crotalus adamanteus]
MRLETRQLDPREPPDVISALPSTAEQENSFNSLTRSSGALAHAPPTSPSHFSHTPSPGMRATIVSPAVALSGSAGAVRFLALNGRSSVTVIHRRRISSVRIENPAANMSSKRAKTKTTKKRPQRATSNVFAMFDQSQIQEFKEAFNMIDQNRDGFIDKEDLHDMLASLGKNPTDEYLDAMMNEAPGPINFTMFLTMFGEKLNGTDPEDVIRNAFACFDEEATGFIQEDYLRELLTTMGDRFTDEEVDELFREAPIDKKGNFNYIEFTRILKHGAKDKDD